jgi:hypothetical protein
VRPDLFLKRARERYQFTRAIYIAPAAIGRAMRSPLVDTTLRDSSADWFGSTGLAVEIWNQVNAVAGVDDSGDELWRTDAATGRNPWTQPP